MASADVLYDVPDRISVQTEWSDKDLIRSIPGSRWSAELKRWTLPLSWASCQALRGVFGARLGVGPNLTGWAEREYATRIGPALEWRERLDAPSRNGTRLFGYQRAGVNFNYVAGSSLLADDMGTGKTLVALATLRSQNLLPAVIICPNSVKDNWRREAAIDFPEATPYVLAGGASARRKLLQEAEHDPSALIIINYEAVRLHSRLAPYGSVRLNRCLECGGKDERVTPARCEVHLKELNLLPLKAVVLDEVHACKDPKSKQTRACWAVAHGATVQHRLGCTGTPIANHVGDLWSVMHTIAPEDYPTKSSFIDRFALLAWNFNGSLEVVGVNPATRDEFFRVLDPRMRRVTKVQVLPMLPPKLRSIRLAEMTSKQAKAYRQMEKELLAELEGRPLVEIRNLTKSLRLLQFSSAYAMVDENDRVHLTEPSPKLDVLEEVLEELGSRPLAVCAESRQLIELAAARLEKRSVSFRLLTGSIPQPARAQALADFQEGRARVLLFTIKAGGVGLTMTAADTILFLQRSWSMLANRQAEDRVHRIGSEIHERIHVIDVVAPGTIEEEQIERLYVKAARLEEILRDRERLSPEQRLALEQEEQAILEGLV